MRYLAVFVIILSGCAINATGMSRDTGEKIIVHYQRGIIKSELSTVVDGETFRGKLISTGDATVSDGSGKSVNVSSNTYRSVLFGDKNRSMRCELCGGFGNGVGSCITSDGETFDIMW